jgi:hypothetical protein
MPCDEFFGDIYLKFSELHGVVFAYEFEFVARKKVCKGRVFGRLSLEIFLILNPTNLSPTAEATNQ